MQKRIKICGKTINPGQEVTVDLPLAHLYTHTETTLSVHVVHGRHPGPRLFVCAAIHGDEINGVEIIRRLLKLKMVHRLRGTLIAIPIVNIYGFINRSRYLPDRRDLNRSFPGSHKGSLAARLARLFMEEIALPCSHGIDLHTGSHHRNNLPQVRACLDDPETERLARTFGAPLVLDSRLRDGSLRQALDEKGIPLLLYEAGEVLRFDETAIRTGLQGVLAVMRQIDMLPRSRRPRYPITPLVARSTTWVRAPISGIVAKIVPLGTRVDRNQPLAVVADPFGEQEEAVPAPCPGMVIGRLNLPLVHEGDALIHLAEFDSEAAPESDPNP